MNPFALSLGSRQRGPCDRWDPNRRADDSDRCTRLRMQDSSHSRNGWFSRPRHARLTMNFCLSCFSVRFSSRVKRCTRFRLIPHCSRLSWSFTGNSLRSSISLQLPRRSGSIGRVRAQLWDRRQRSNHAVVQRDRAPDPVTSRGWQTRLGHPGGGPVRHSPLGKRTAAPDSGGFWTRKAGIASRHSAEFAPISSLSRGSFQTSLPRFFLPARAAIYEPFQSRIG